jgi:hypothetical protein
MSSEKGYVKEINPNAGDSHQTSPGYMLTFIRWNNRDTFNYNGKGLDAARSPLVVYNDAISVTTSDQKSSTTPSLSAVLLGGDLNYSTAIHPGDYVMVNMVNWESEVSVVDLGGFEVGTDTLRKKVAALQPLNNYEDGFKGLFKVQTITRELRTDPGTGNKTVVYNLKAFGFTEFNSMVYYDPQVFGALSGNLKLFQSHINSYWSEKMKNKDTFSIQALLQILISMLMGNNTLNPNTKLPSPQVTYFLAPPILGSLLGLENVKYMCNIYNYVLGIWASSNNAATPAAGFNPGVTRNKKEPGGFYKCAQSLDGSKLIEAEYWNNVKIWSILQKYANLTINEMYTTNRVNIDGRIMPTLVIRQKPFSSLHYKHPTAVTKFLTLPRWKISPDLIYDYSLGTDETARVNYVQVYTRSISANNDKNRTEQTGVGNFVADVDDIRRNGLKTYLATASFDWSGESGKPTKAKTWAKLVADWVINGNLRESGVISCVGIQEPIAVGDNIELGGVVYHIEGVSHHMEINRGNGSKTFRTTLSVSFGTHLDSDDKRPVYPQMEHTDAFTERLEDHRFPDRQMMPGFSDTQAFASKGSRPGGEEVKETVETSYTLNPKQRNKPKPKAKPKASAKKKIDIKTKSNVKKIDPEK